MHVIVLFYTYTSLTDVSLCPLVAFILFSRYSLIIAGGISLLFLPPWACLVLVATVGATDAVLLGFMGILDIRLNTLTAIWTMLSIGLTIDYSAHVAHAFMQPQHRQMLAVDSDPAVLLDHFAAYQPPNVSKWISSPAAA